MSAVQGASRVNLRFVAMSCSAWIDGTAALTMLAALCWSGAEFTLVRGSSGCRPLCSPGRLFAKILVA